MAIGSGQAAARARHALLLLSGERRRAGGRGALRDGKEIWPVGAGEVIVDWGRLAGHFRLLAESESGSVRRWVALNARGRMPHDDVERRTESIPRLRDLATAVPGSLPRGICAVPSDHQVDDEVENEELRGLGQPFHLTDDPPRNSSLEAAQVFLKLRGGVYSIHSSCFNRSRERVSPFRWCDRAWRMRARKSAS